MPVTFKELMEKNLLEKKAAREQGEKETYTKVTDKDDDGEGLDPVGKGDADIDNDGDSDKTDDYLAKRRAAIAKTKKKSDDMKEAIEEATRRKKAPQMKADIFKTARNGDDAKKSANVARGLTPTGRDRKKNSASPNAQDRRARGESFAEYGSRILEEANDAGMEATALKFALKNNGKGTFMTFQKPTIDALKKDGLVKIGKKISEIESEYMLTPKGKMKAETLKEDVSDDFHLNEAKKEKAFVGTSDGSSWAVNMSGVKNGNQPTNLGWVMANKETIADFKKSAKKTFAGAKGKATLPAVKKHLKMVGATEYYAKWKSDSSSYKDDSVEIWYKESAMNENDDMSKEEKALDMIANPNKKKESLKESMAEIVLSKLSSE